MPRTHQSIPPDVQHQQYREAVRPLSIGASSVYWGQADDYTPSETARIKQWADADGFRAYTNDHRQIIIERSPS